MENIDFDNDTTPDGIINLYDEYTAATGLTIQNGVWSVNPNYTIALDPNTGNVSLWALQFSTENDTIDEYTFQLRNGDCGDVVALTVNLILGPFSGIALPPGPNDANIEICDEEGLNLYEALASDETIPSPHLNGEWVYVGNSSGPGFEGSFILDGSSFSASIPYQEGLPLVDQEVFELKYVVPGIAPCDPFQETTVKVSVVRQVEAGTATRTFICESDIRAGLYDDDIDLRDDQYLADEDIEGGWLSDLDITGQISDPGDSMINIREIYDVLIDNGNNLRFGCQDYEFTYEVKKRSAVCSDDSETVTFSIYEELRQFEQKPEVPELCANREDAQFDLYDLIAFAEENNQSFEYNNDDYVNWRLVSGPSDLNVTRQPAINAYRGTINLTNAERGTYVFEYGVHPSINCPIPGVHCNPFAVEGESDYCSSICAVLTTEITIVVLGFDYAGENTTVSLCESIEEVDLRSLLRANSGNTVVDTGVWTDQDGNIIDNTFVFPDSEISQTFTFTYTTTSADNCIDVADLTITIFKESNAGIDVVTPICSDSLIVTLFDQLEGDPDPTGTWIGPFGYESEGHLGVFDINDNTLPILGPGEYVYTVPGNEGCPDPDSATVTIEIVDPIEIGSDRNFTFCKLEGRVNLYSLLDVDTVRFGIFEDTDNTGALSPEGVLEFETLTNNIYNFRYVVANELPCDESALNVAVQIVDLPIPVVPDQEFCILDAKRLDDIEVDVLNYNWYDSLESDIPIINNPILLDNQIFYIANVDADNCESERLAVSINILNTGERFSNGEFCTLDFQDGVSPDGNNQNDTFDLLIEGVYNIPEALPDFELKIYNRYGGLVYNGNRNTEEFRGESNVSLRLGDDLPSGTYFYIFTPNFENNLPIQGSFYLSR
ncbi:gliding motility-associated C-terminal domain-containing protein [Aquimarina sp. 2201CG5-10]|uniref:gliding motility-associated C-terminal domain-containing protein n=1 Tax=Aquimarina callyspongiae TaxID=3098150 RepID=UPI002AB49CB6|nr:gliding motility-associated C-terminal domain-containing protein [Aquimarina sp. 2201CG5-10]MDY8135747.1 gliding motility-associated C-terminal domain-containing protein [Aquimarina sp. 2201CG5-10]